MNSTNAWRYQWHHPRLLFPTPPNFIQPAHNRKVLNVEGCMRGEEGQWTEKEAAVLPKEAATQRRKLWATNRDRYSVPQQPGPCWWLLQKDHQARPAVGKYRDGATLYRNGWWRQLPPSPSWQTVYWSRCNSPHKNALQQNFEQLQWKERMWKVGETITTFK